MRRTTNKRGKQAPAPPKRTRYVEIGQRKYLPLSAFAEISFLFFHFSLLSTSRDSTYRDDDGKDDINTNGTIAKSSSCSSFLIDMLFRGIFLFVHTISER